MPAWLLYPRMDREMVLRCFGPKLAALVEEVALILGSFEAAVVVAAFVWDDWSDWDAWYHVGERACFRGHILDVMRLDDVWSLADAGVDADASARARGALLIAACSGGSLETVQWVVA